MTTHTSWICPECRDYNCGDQTRCAYCGQSAEFLAWLTAVDTELADRDETRDSLPYRLDQWWDMWDCCVAPDDAVTAALILRADNFPASLLPAHAAYVNRYSTN